MNKPPIEERKHFLTIIDGRYASTSASQVKAYESCARLWFNQSILKLRQPQTPAQAFGSAVHKAIENFLLHNTLPEDPRLESFVEVAGPYLPADALVEHYIEIPTIDNVVWRGYIDCLDLSSNFILDYKSTSDFKYAKDSEQLANDVQMVSYAKWFVDKYNLDGAEVGHLYLLTKNKKPKAKLVTAEISRNHANKIWNEKLVVVAEMAQVVDCLYDKNNPTKDRTEELSPTGATTGVCDMYGGCPFRTKCGLNEQTITRIINFGKKEKEMGTSLSEKLAAKKSVTPPSTQPADTVITLSVGDEPTVGTNPTINNVSGIVSILPPDAPPNEEVEPLSVTLAREEGVIKKARKKSKEVVDEINLGDFSTKREGVPSLNRKRLVIYQDCIPIKGDDRAKWVMLEDWLAPIAQSVAEAHGQADYRLIQYTAKPALATAVRSKLDTVPEVLIVSSYAAGADVVMECLIPLATQVVKALKG